MKEIKRGLDDTEIYQAGPLHKRKRGRPRKIDNSVQDYHQPIIEQPAVNSNQSVLLTRLIQHGSVAHGDRVIYREVKKRPQLTTGTITSFGILCDCCEAIFSLSEFEAHAGSTRHRPAENIILEDQRSLAQCKAQLELKPHRILTECNPQLEGKALRNLADSIAQSEGKAQRKLPDCIAQSEGRPLRKLADCVAQLEGMAHKRSTDCKVQLEDKCESAKTKRGRKKNARKEVKRDFFCSFCYEDGDLITCHGCPSVFHKRCLDVECIPDAGDAEWYCPFCCCNFCNKHTLPDNDVPRDNTILSCDQCPRKLHVGCARSIGVTKLKRESSKDNWFCCDTCEFVFSGLQQLLRKPVRIDGDNLTWTMLGPTKSTDEASLTNNKKLKRALELMHMCFEPVKEDYTGKDLVRDMIFSKACKLTRLNFRRFYTIVIEKNNEMVAVANVRVSGDKIAEVPLVGTHFDNRKEGMCRKLMNELEKQLMSLGVEKLVLPAAPSTVDIWTTKFGFSERNDGDRRAHSNYPILFFYKTKLCQKFLRRSLQQDQDLS